MRNHHNMRDNTSSLHPSEGTKVLVLLSTYNGERYLKEQLESVLSQRGIDAHLLVRDDGSLDETRSILDEYKSIYPDSLDCVFGENVGVLESFSRLVQMPMVKDYDWVAFCDQDDIWLPDKLAHAIYILQKLQSDRNQPLLYCSNLIIVNEKLELIRRAREAEPNHNIRTALVQNIGTGCTEVFNRRACELYCLGINPCAEFHDYWMYLICECFGKVYYDLDSYILYRQHSSNVVGARTRTLSSAIKNLASTEHGKRLTSLEAFRLAYSDLFNDEQDRTIGLFLGIKDSLSARVKVFLDPRICGVDLAVTIGFKIRVVLGKVY